MTMPTPSYAIKYKNTSPFHLVDVVVLHIIVSLYQHSLEKRASELNPFQKNLQIFRAHRNILAKQVPGAQNHTLIYSWCRIA